MIVDRGMEYAIDDTVADRLEGFVLEQVFLLWLGPERISPSLARRDLWPA